MSRRRTTEASQTHAHSFREDEVHDLQPGDHHCHVFETPDQSLTVLVPFLAEGLEQGHRCVASLARTSAEEVQAALEQRGVDPQARIDAGDLTLRSTEEGYEGTGTFDIDGRIDQLEAMVLKASEDGYEVLRSAGEMSWAAEGGLDRETLTTYEAELNRFFDEGLGQHVVGLCQYHISAFEPGVLADVLRTHPITIHGTRVRENLFYQPPDVFLSADPQDEIDHMLDRLAQEQEGAKAAEELEERNERLKRFTEAIGQDLKEPLQAIQAHLDRLDGLSARPWPGGGKSVEYAVEGAGRMERRLEALLEYARVESGALDLTQVDSGQLLEGALSELEPRLEQADVELTHDAMPTVEADGDLLTSVFRNLVANALEHGGPDLSRIHVGVEDLGSSWRFFVEDEGKGITRPDQDRLVELFERGPDPGTEEGVGLGLALCRLVADRHGGGIDVESEPGEGTTVSVTIPAGG